MQKRTLSLNMPGWKTLRDCEDEEDIVVLLVGWKEGEEEEGRTGTATITAGVRRRCTQHRFTLM